MHRFPESCGEGGAAGDTMAVVSASRGRKGEKRHLTDAILATQCFSHTSSSLLASPHCTFTYTANEGKNRTFLAINTSLYHISASFYSLATHNTKEVLSLLHL